MNTEMVQCLRKLAVLDTLSLIPHTYIGADKHLYSCPMRSNGCFWLLVALKTYGTHADKIPIHIIQTNKNKKT